MTEQFANNATTSLNGSITSGATSLVVTSSSLFPSSGNFRVSIDGEIILVTGVSGTTWTVTRAQENTTAIAHNSGAAVTHILTSGALTQLKSDTIQATHSSGLSTARPSATGSGTLYFCTDIPALYFDDPSTNAWKQFATEYMSKPAAASSYTVVGNVNLTQLGDAIRAVRLNNNATSCDVAVIPTSLSSSGTWAVSLTCVWMANLGATFPMIGVCVTNGVTSGSSVGYAMFMYSNGAGPTTGQLGGLFAEFTVGGARIGSQINSVVVLYHLLTSAGRLHMRLLNDGTILHAQVSPDHYHWQDWTSVASPISPTNYGFLMGTEETTGSSWSQATIFENSLTTSLTQATVTGATGSGVPVMVTVASTAGFLAGDLVSVHGMVGNTAANTTSGNGPFSSGIIVTAINNSTQMTLNATGNGTWTSGGIITLLSR